MSVSHAWRSVSCAAYDVLGSGRPEYVREQCLFVRILRIKGLKDNISQLLHAPPALCPWCLNPTRRSALDWLRYYGPVFFLGCPGCGLAFAAADLPCGVITLGPNTRHTLLRHAIRILGCSGNGIGCRCPFCTAERTHQRYWGMIGSVPYPVAHGIDRCAHGQRLGHLRGTQRSILAWKADAARAPFVAFPATSASLTFALSDDVGSSSDDDDWRTAYKRRVRPGNAVPTCTRCGASDLICLDDSLQRRAKDHLCVRCGRVDDDRPDVVLAPLSRQSPLLAAWKLYIDSNGLHPQGWHGPRTLTCRLCLTRFPCWLGGAVPHLSSVLSLCGTCGRQRIQQIRTGRDPLCMALSAWPWLRDRRCPDCDGRLASLGASKDEHLVLCTACGRISFMCYTWYAIAY
jgi:hypothetical protein